MNSKLLFGNCAELRSEKVDPKSAQESYYIGLEHIEQQTLSLAGHGYGSDVDSQKQKFFEGDILFGKLRPYFRKVVVAPFDGICSTDVWVVKPKAKKPSKEEQDDIDNDDVDPDMETINKFTFPDGKKISYVVHPNVLNNCKLNI